MTMENPPFEDVFPIDKWGFPNVMLVFGGVIGNILGHCSHLICEHEAEG